MKKKAGSIIKSVETADIASLNPHPKNYRKHPADQLEHLKKSLKANGFYRNVVVADDNTILAGHGVIEGAKALGWKQAPIIRLNIKANSPQALKILAGDNEISHLSENDDRALTELLREVKDKDIDGLMGTGYDDKMLAALAFVTRPASELQDFNAAAAWVGMPTYEPNQNPLKIVVSFKNKKDRAEFAKRLGINLTEKTRAIWWPEKEKDDNSSLRFTDKKK